MSSSAAAISAAAFGPAAAASFDQPPFSRMLTKVSCACGKFSATSLNSGASWVQANQLCGLDLGRFKEALADGAPVTVACTQEAPLFREVAENFPQAQPTFFNIRENGG